MAFGAPSRGNYTAPGAGAQNRFPLQPTAPVAPHAAVGFGSGRAQNTEIADRNREILDWLAGVPQQRALDSQDQLQSAERGGRALRAMQRAFSTMNAIAMGGAAAGGSPLGGNNRDPLGLSSRPMGKAKFGV